MKQINRVYSFIIITAIYLLAIAVGVAVYLILPLENWLALLIADVAATIFTFIFSVIFKNASVYDPYWSVQPPVILLAFAIGKGFTPATILLLVAVFFWGIRLTANWAYTFHGLSHQDWRYTMLKEKTKAFYPIINFVGIHLVPTLVVYACTLPAVFAITSGATINVGAIIFVCISILSATMQGIADVQMHRYRKLKPTPFIRVGLWKYSRHPNYLGEILMWWGIGLAVVCMLPNLWYTLAGAILNTMLFMFVSIPMADKRQSAKNGFEQYKAQTRMLLPIYKKQNA